MGEPLPIEAHEAIIKCIWIAHAEVVYASDRIAELAVEDAVGPVVTTVDRPLKEEKGAESSSERAKETRVGEPRLHIWIKARHEAMDRLVAYSAAAMKANVDERRVKLAEDQAAQIAGFGRTLLERLGLDPAAPESRQAFRAALMTIDGTATEVGGSAA